MKRWDLFKKLSKRLTEVEVGQNSFGQLLIQSKVGQKFWHKLHLAEKPSLTLSFKFELTLIQSKVIQTAWTQSAQSFLSPYDAPNLARYLWTAIEYIYQNLYIFKIKVKIYQIYLSQDRPGPLSVGDKSGQKAGSVAKAKCLLIDLY